MSNGILATTLGVALSVLALACGSEGGDGSAGSGASSSGTNGTGASCTECGPGCEPCPVDCGDGLCSGGETCDSCAADCGACDACAGASCGAADACCPQGCTEATDADCTSTTTGLIPADRRIEWSPGVPGGIPSYPVCGNATDPPWNAKGDGSTDDTAAIQAALDDCPE